MLQFKVNFLTERKNVQDFQESYYSYLINHFDTEGDIFDREDTKSNLKFFTEQD